MRTKDGVIFPDLVDGQSGGSTQLHQEVTQQFAAFKEDMKVLLASQPDLERKMDERKESRSSNVTTGGTRVQGNVSFGGSGTHIGDNVVGDKHVHGDQTTNVGSVESTTTVVFASGEDKQQFIEDIEALQKTLKKIRREIEDAESMDDDEREQLADDVRKEEKTLRKAGEEAGQMPVNEPVSAEQRATIAQSLDNTKTVLDKVKAVGKSAAGVWETVKPYVMAALPLLKSARHLFGLP